MPMSDLVEVLIVGAGPVGLTAAIELRRRDVSVRIVDRKSEASTTSRALGTHARTIEVYGHLGVQDRILERAQKLHRFTVHTGGKQTTAFGYDFGDLHPEYDFSAFIGQADTEAVLRERLGELGVEVEWNTEMTALAQDAAGVDATLRFHAADPGEARVRAAWLIGADGGHSTIRKKLALPFEGASDETWIVTDALLRTDLPPDSIHMFRHRDGNLLIFPFPESGKWRVLETRPPADGNERHHDEMRRSFARRMSDASGCRVRVDVLTWVSRFTIQQRQVPRLRVGQVFLAGDAAHVHSPASGQGMNTGIQDAFNLAWKIALVHAGRAKDALLDSYDRERIPVSAALLRSAGIATRLIQSREGLTHTLFTAALRIQDTIPWLHRRVEKRIAAQLSALGVGYGPGASGADQAGSRFPALPRDLRQGTSGSALTRWLRGPEVKLLLTGPQAEALGSALAAMDCAVAVLGGFGSSVEALPDPNREIAMALQADDARTTLWAIRPDGYLLARLDEPDRDRVQGILRTANLDRC